MADWPAALMHKKPRPFKLGHHVPAGVTSEKNGDRYRSCVVLPMGRIETYKVADRWNTCNSKFYSSLPAPILGFPFDTSKPRKGRWGETLGGSKSSYESSFFDYAWDKMKVSRKDRESQAMEDARKDLQKRIEICLYGAPRTNPLETPCPKPRL